MPAPRRAGVATAMVAAHAAFALRLVGQLAGEETATNLFLSPANLAFGLAMVHSGAAGRTQREMGDVLGLAAVDLDDVSRGNAELQRALGEVRDVRLVLASALWADRRLTFDRGFLRRVTGAYALEARVVDFADPTTPSIINDWASRKTGGQIDTLLDATDLTPPVDCVLTNAAYFKGAWTLPFDRRLTREGSFAVPGRRRKRVPMMSRSGTFGYLETATFRAVRLPYGDGRVSMCLWLPDARSSLPAFVRDLTAEGWPSGMTRFVDTPVDLAVPRFAVAYDTDLREHLAALGMIRAFGPGADFTPMGLAGHYIAKVQHRARVEVSEEGTQAAAATAVVMGRRFVSPVPLTIDRPFFCAIRDDRSGLPLFMGAVVDPA